MVATLVSCNCECSDKANKKIAERNKQTCVDFFKTLENEDAKGLTALFAADAVHVNPYSSGIFPEGAKGREAIFNYWKPVFPNFDGMTYPIDYILATENPNFIIVKYKGQIKLKNDAGIYENNYYSTFKFNSEGQITEYVEIFNPSTAAKAFGLIEKIK